ncbi:hypothetical protein [Halorussus lipolyticus]|uniref:hypothetical protein n=1 Tax=Halorussus lipolyticus TaxID=3034024 RepID=UPI0023E8C195|nr:hypothetical protein [Halorussus sp. DT80]
MVRLELRELLEEKTGALLLIAGGFLLFQTMVRTLPDFVGFAVSERLPEWAGFIFSAALPDLIGLAIPFIALFGLYHRLTSETPRLAVVGVALMALTPTFFVSGLLTLLIRPLPELPYLLWLSPLPYMLGTGCFGLAFFWKNGSIRFVGIPLLVFSGTWILLYAVSLKNGEVPDWLPTVELLAMSLVTMGYLLSTDSATRHEGTPADN